MSANYINIYGILHNDTPEGVIAEAEQILDSQEGKKQSVINQERKGKDEELESSISKNRIGSVEVEVEQNTGTPSGQATFYNNVMKFLFRGIKGEKGDDGIQGQKGDQGNSGVSGDVSSLVVVNSLDGGESEPESIKVLAAAQGPVIRGMIEKNILAIELDEEGGIYAVSGSDDSAFVNGGIDEDTGYVYLDFNYQ